MSISLDDVKRLRSLTGVGLTDAKKALEEVDGDFDKALSAMRKKGLTKAEKRGEREARSGVISTYNHDNRIGVLVELNCETDFVARNELFTGLVKDICMHIAASSPEYVDIQSIPKAEQNKIRAEFKEKAQAEGKPAEIIDKIVDGMVGKYFSEKCLLDQPFVKNPDVTVGDYLKEHIAKLGENIVIRRFNRMQLGEIS